MACQIDFRGIDEGRGRAGKRKRTEEAQAIQAEKNAALAVSMDTDGDGDAAAAADTRSKRFKSAHGDILCGKVSGRPWKAPQLARTSAMKRAGSKSLATSWDKKMADKAARKGFQEKRDALKEEVRQAKRAKRVQQEAAKKRKEEKERENIRGQKVTNPATIKKIMKSKKDRKKLVQVPG